MVLVVFTAVKLDAQENKDKDKQKDLLKKQIQIEKQKQKMELDSISINAQAASEDELKILIEEQKKDQAEGQDLIENSIRVSPRGERRISRNRDGSSYSYSYSYGNPPKVFFGGMGDNTTFTISKKIKDAITFSSDFEYDVPENVSGLNFSFGSELETGSLKLTITKPNGKVYQVFSVAPVANVDWNKQLKIKEGEAKDYSGSWKITISTKDAKGYYELKIISF